MASTAMSQALLAQKNEQNKGTLERTQTENGSASEESLNTTIQQLAYALWERRGCPAGSAEQDWSEAEQQVLDSRPATTTVGR